MSTIVSAPKGFEGIVAANSGICFIDGENGVLSYRGYDIHELADHSTFEEVCFLLWHRRLPSRAELGDLQSQLIAGRPTTVDGDNTPISPKMVDALRPMMRLVVTNGTAKEIAGCCGEVYGKTGEAEFPGGSHSWFAGYRGDLAFAALIVGGGSSEYAVRMTKVMFESLPRDYLA